MVGAVSRYNSERDRQRLETLDAQLDEIGDKLLSVDMKQKIREAADLYARWLEADDELQSMGLNVAIDGGVEYPNATGRGVGVVHVDKIEIGVVTIRSA